MSYLYLSRVYISNFFQQQKLSNTTFLMATIAEAFTLQNEKNLGATNKLKVIINKQHILQNFFIFKKVFWKVFWKFEFRMSRKDRKGRIIETLIQDVKPVIIYQIKHIISFFKYHLPRTNVSKEDRLTFSKRFLMIFNLTN